MCFGRTKVILVKDLGKKNDQKEFFYESVW